MEQAFANTAIAFKLMHYSYSLMCFFKDEFKKNGVYVIPFSHVLHVKRTIFPLIRDACGYVCPYQKQCDGHQFLDFVEKLWEFELYAVTERKCFFREFHFYDFRFKSDKNNEIKKVAGWDFHASIVKDLSHLSYSQRLTYLD